MNTEDCMYIHGSSEKSCLCLKVFVGKGVVAEKESTPFPLWATLSQSPLQNGHLLAAFVTLGAWLLSAWMQQAERNGSADVLRNCWRIVISMVLMQGMWTMSIGGGVQAYASVAVSGINSKHLVESKALSLPVLLLHSPLWARSYRFF